MAASVGTQVNTIKLAYHTAILPIYKVCSAVAYLLADLQAHRAMPGQSNAGNAKSMLGMPAEHAITNAPRHAPSRKPYIMLVKHILGQNA